MIDREASTNARTAISRRRMMSLMAGGVAVTSAGLLLPAGAAQAAGVTSYPGVDGQHTWYEPNGKRQDFKYNPTFHDQLGTWLEFWYVNTPIAYKKPLRVYSYGCYVANDPPPDDAHKYGRGFDLSQIYATENGNIHRVFTGRHDIWSGYTGADFTIARRHYWATAASAHYYFRDVLTYLFNSAHDNHIHIDNTVTGTGSTYDTTSKAQTQHVQACLNYIWGKSVTIDGEWGSQTESNSTSVLRRIGQTTGNLKVKANWAAFNKASLRKGFGTEAY